MSRHLLNWHLQRDSTTGFKYNRRQNRQRTQGTRSEGTSSRPGEGQPESATAGTWDLQKLLIGANPLIGIPIRLLLASLLIRRK
jgi:hypothetical protein